MNFMNRRMFAEAGPVVAGSNLGSYEIFDKATGQVTKVNPGFLNNITAKAQYAYPLLNGYKAGQIELGQGVLQELEAFRKVDEPFGLSGDISSDTRIDDIGTAAFDLGRGTLRALEGPLRGIAGFAGELTGVDALKDISSFDFKNMQKKDFNPIIPTREENRSQLLQDITNRGLGNVGATEDVADFTEELKAIDGSGTITDQPSVIEELPTLTEELPTFTPTTSGESIGQLYEPGSVGRLEQDQRRLAYEASLIGVDEFGDPIEKPGIDDEITNLIKELTPAEIKVDINKTEADSLLETQEKFSPKFDMPKVDLNKVDTTITEDFDTAKPPRPPKETSGLFGSDRFLDFIRNVGGELSRTGQMGEGLASGAAKAAEERAARDLLEAQEQKKFDRELEIAGAVGRAKADADNKPDIMKPEKILILNNDVKRDITDFKGGLAGVGFVDYAIEIIVEAQAKGEPVGGLQGLFARAVDAGFAFAGMPKDFDSQSADSKVKALTEVVKQKNLQAILGESGRTISDKDRVIIEKVFGDLSLFENVDSVLGKLRESRRGLAESNNTRYENIQTNSEFLRLQGTYGQDFYTKMLPSLESILGINPYASQADTARARFGEQAGVGGADSQPIKDIDYK